MQIVFEGKPYDLEDEQGLSLAVTAKAGRLSAKLDDAQVRQAFEELYHDVLLMTLRFGGFTGMVKSFTNIPIDRELLHQIALGYGSLVGMRPADRRDEITSPAAQIEATDNAVAEGADVPDNEEE